VTIPLYYEGHAYRAGSQIRVTIAAPNGTQPIWAFDRTEPEGTAQVAIAYGGSTPSNLLLPVVPEVDVPTGLPPCPGLRGEPCRDYQPLTNLPASPAPPGSTTTPAPPPVKHPKCHKVFKKKKKAHKGHKKKGSHKSSKKKVKRRTVCGKAKKHRHKHRHHRHHSSASR
jgi:hypothetical protein